MGEQKRLADPAADRRRFIAQTSTAELLEEVYLCACLAESKADAWTKKDAAAKVEQIKAEIVRRKEGNNA